MKTRPIHPNEEFLKGFVEALMAEYEIGLGPFLNKLHDFIIDVSHSKLKDSTLVTIYFSIEGDKRDDLHVYFHVSERDTIDLIRTRVQLVVEEIISTVKSFECEQA